MTTALCGAWSLSGAPIETQLSESDKKAVFGRLEAGGASLRALSLGPLWLVGRAEKITRNEGRFLAVEGFIAPGQDLSAAIKRLNPQSPWDIELDGHYALVYADPAAGLLLLTRDIGGGERLYYARLPDILLFSASLWPLLAHSQVPRKPDSEMIREYAFNGALLSPGRTLFSGINEIQPGQRLILDNGKQDCRYHEMAAPEENSKETAPERLRRGLTRATCLAIGKDREAAIALSGGIDSSAIAALAVEALGAKNVHAFTYEFDDPGLISEAPLAAAVCRYLGIRDHQVVKLSLRDHEEAIPETIWRSEEPGTMRGNPAVLLLARHARDRGFAKLLSGAAMEVLLRIPAARYHYLDALAAAIPRLADVGCALERWKISQFPGWKLPQPSPSLGNPDAPPPHLYFLILAVLRHNGFLRDMGAFYPPELSTLARQTTQSWMNRERIAGMKQWTLGDQLRYLCFTSHDFSRNIHRKVKFTREIGCVFTAPAYFRVCMSDEKYLSWHTAQAPKQFPKLLLQQAMRGILPEEALARSKIEDNMICPTHWLEESLRKLEPLVSKSAKHLDPYFLGEFKAVRSWLAPSAARLALWHRLFIELPLRTSPPSWDDLR